MEFGLHLPNAGAAATAGSILEVARAAEDLGFESAWCFDHLFTPVDLQTDYPYQREGRYFLSAQDPFFDPVALFGVLMGATSKVKLGTGVMIAAYRHPIVLAKILATIDNFSPGRMMLGLGAGWMREEFDALGIPFERRGARLDEYIEALRTMWAAPTSSFEGDFYSWTEAGFLPNPIQPIPIIVGGHSEPAMRRAARIGDGWAVVTGKGSQRAEGIAPAINKMKELLEKEGRDPAGFQLMMQHILWFSDEPNPKLPFTGPPEAIAEKVKEMQELGVTSIDLIVYGPSAVIVENAERFAREVRPLL